MEETIKPNTEYGIDRYTAVLTKKDNNLVVVHFVISESDDTEPNILTGYVKWDGCMETHGGYHTCSLRDIESIQQFLIQVYRKAHEMLGEKANFTI